MIKYVKELREGLEPLISRSAKFSAAQILHSDGSKDEVPIYRTSSTLLPTTLYDDKWNADLIFDGKLRIGEFETYLYRNGTFAFEQSNCGGSPEWRMRMGCEIVSRFTLGSTYDTRKLAIIPKIGHLDHIHIEVAD